MTLSNLAAVPEFEEGVTLEAPSVAKTANLNGTGTSAMTLKLNDVVLYDHDGNKNTKGDHVTLNGEVSLEASAEMDIEIDDGLKNFTFKVTSDQKSSVSLASGLYIDIEKKKIKLNKAPLVFANTTVWIGYVPVVVTFALDIYAGADGTISVGTSTHVTQNLGSTGGVRYSGKKWTIINEPRADYSFQQPTVDAAADIRAYVQPELSAKLYGVAGPGINLQGYFKLLVQPLETPWWQLYAGFQVNVKADITVLGRQIAEYEQVILDISSLLAQADAQPDRQRGHHHHAAAGCACGSVRSYDYSGFRKPDRPLLDRQLHHGNRLSDRTQNRR